MGCAKSDFHCVMRMPAFHSYCEGLFSARIVKLCGEMNAMSGTWRRIGCDTSGRVSLRILARNAALHLVILMHLPISAEAQIYKWVNRNGKVQYGDMPPSDRQSPAQLAIKPGQVTELKSPSDWEEKDREFRKRRIERQMKAEKEQPAISAQQLCLNARYKLQMLDGTVLYRIDDKGERVYMEDAERSAIEKKAQQDISMYCRR